MVDKKEKQAGRVLTQIPVMAPHWTRNELENLKNPTIISRALCLIEEDDAYGAKL